MDNDKESQVAPAQIAPSNNLLHDQSDSSQTVTPSPGSISTSPEKKEFEFKPDHRLWLAFGTLATLTMMVALDGTSISVALPVSKTLPHGCRRRRMLYRVVELMKHHLDYR